MNQRIKIKIVSGCCCIQFLQTSLENKEKNQANRIKKYPEKCGVTKVLTQFI